MKNILDGDNNLDNHPIQKKESNLNSDLVEPNDIEDEDFYSQNLDDDDLVPDDESNFDLELDQEPEPNKSDG